MLKKLLLTVMMAVSLVAISGQDNSAEAYWGMVVNCRESITLRTYPSTEADEILQIPLGDWVWIDNNYYNNGFYLADYNGYHGYVLAAYITYVKD